MSESEPLYFEDIALGQVLTSDWYRVEREAIIDFARAWDPQPFHLDEDAAKASIFGGLAACAPHLFAILSRLSFDLPRRLVIVAGLGGDGLDLIAPVYADTDVRLIREFTATRSSKSRPEVGIATFADRLENREGQTVFRTAGSVLVARKSAI